MSIQAMNWVKHIRGLPATEKHVLLAIADHYNEEKRVAWPGRGLLADETGLSVRHISRVVNKLNELKFSDGTPVLQVQHWIDIDTGRHFNNRYFLPGYNHESGRGEPAIRRVENVSVGSDFELEIVR